MPSITNRNGPAAWPTSLNRSFVAARITKPIAYLISGLTLDSTGTPIAGVRVTAFCVQTQTSVAAVDSGADGSYALSVSGDPSLTFIVQAYKAGAPDLTGLTVNTLTGALG